MATNVFGLVGTPVTPFTEDGEVDHQGVQTAVDFLIRHGVDGLALPMHIGENLKLTSQERKDLAASALEAAEGRVPVLINTSLAGTREVVELSQHAEEHGAAGVVVITPYHWRPGPEALVEHFTTVGRSIEGTLVAYNYPLRLGVQITTDVIRRVIEACPNFLGLKDASLDMEYFTEVCRVTNELRPEFAVFTGVEYILPGMSVGAKGSFSACGAIAPTLIRDLYEACAAADFERARPLQYKVSRLFAAISVGYPSMIKVAMEFVGRPAGPSRQPTDSFTDDQRRYVESELRALGLPDNEPSGW